MNVGQSGARITEAELLSAAADCTRKRERVEVLLHEAVEFERPLEAAWLAQRIVDALEADDAG